MSYSIKCIDPRHRDLLHDIAFDYYGKRMVTGSSDQCVKVWDLDPSTQEWKQTAAWKAHSGSVWKVTWAHPDFGQIIATCSFDRTAAVWEEIYTDGVKSDRNVQWIRRTNFVDSRTSVTDVKFAPKVLGLVLATCSVDGLIRVYEAPDTTNLCQWTLQHEVVSKLQSSCIAWNMPVKGDGFQGSKSKIKIPTNVERKDVVYVPDEYNKSIMRCPLPLEKRDSYIVIPQRALMAVGSDDASSTHKLVMLQFPLFSQRQTKLDLVFPLPDPVYDLAFAPRVGRGYDILAVATKDIKLFSICQVMDNTGSLRYEIAALAVQNDHQCSVWRVSWNILGSLMATSGDDGIVRLWRSFPYQDNSLPKRTEPEKGLPHEVEVERKKTAHDFNQFTSGFFSVWKCTHTFKGDDQIKSPEGIHIIRKGGDYSTGTRFIKLANVSHPSLVPWH